MHTERSSHVQRSIPFRFDIQSRLLVRENSNLLGDSRGISSLELHVFQLLDSVQMAPRGFYEYWIPSYSSWSNGRI